MKTQVPVYKSIFKGKKGLQESKQKQLKKIVESLKGLKKRIREEDDDMLTSTDESPEVSAKAIGDIIDKVEDLVVDAIDTLGATGEVTSELIATAGNLESMQDEEEMIAAIDASAQEADEIQEEFDPMYDAEDDYIEDEFMGDDEVDVMDDEFMVDDEDYMDDDYEVYESFSKQNKVKKFKK